MEAINNRLNISDCTTVAQIFSQLVQTVVQKHKSESKEIPELLFLKEKCIDLNSSVAKVACRGIVNLVEIGVLDLKTVLSDFNTFITTSRFSPEVVLLISNLLLLDVDRQVSKTGYNCDFNLRLPQHPFITLMNENLNCLSNVFAAMSYSYKDSRSKPYCNQLYKPFYLYVLGDPIANNLASFKQKLWTLMLQNIEPQSLDILKDLLYWIQIQNPSMIEVNSDLINELAEANLEIDVFDPELLVLFQSSCLYWLIQNDCDPYRTIDSMKIVISASKCSKIADCILIILAKSIPVCSFVYLEKLLDLCKLILLKESPNTVALQTLKSSLLHWIANPSILTTKITQLAQELLLIIQQRKSQSMKKDLNSELILKFIEDNTDTINTNSEVYHCLQLVRMLDGPKWPKLFIQKLTDVSDFFLLKWAHLLFGLFLSDFEDVQISSQLLQLIKRCASCDQKINSQVLTVFLYKLSNTTEGNLHFHLLKALPKTVVVRNNFGKVLSVIQALCKEPGVLQTFGHSLLLDLWKMDNKCYPHLENILISTLNTSVAASEWEFNVTRAHILKELCCLKPELHGREMVAHLSKVLNECNDPDGGLACSLAIDGITALCRVEIVDAITIWANLAPKFKKDIRVPVIRSLCSFISEIPQLSYTEAYPQLIEEVVETLWSYVSNTTNLEIWKAALDALSSFSTEQIIARFPKEYLIEEDNVNIKRGLHSSSEQHWINFLRNCTTSTMTVAGDFLIKMISLEIDAYLKYVYQVKGTREPNDYSFLPANSVVRVIGWYLKSQVHKRKGDIYEDVYFECLRIFSQQYSKPLPPLDWCFLQELIHEPKYKNPCIDIACHQVMISGTARRFVENYIIALTENHNDMDDDVFCICKNLKYLAKSIQPAILKPFLEVALLDSIEIFKRGDDNSLIKIERCLRETLQDPQIQEANKIVIAQIIGTVLDSTELFNILLNSIIHFPTKQIEDLTSPKCAKDPLTAEWFQRSVKIRTHLAKNVDKNPLQWLNDLIDSGAPFKTLIPYVYEQFASVFLHHKDNTECALWLLDLIGEVEALAADKVEMGRILFRCDIFFLATIVFSGHLVYLDDVNDGEINRTLCPQAVADLLDVNHWSICTAQALDWFYQMHNDEMVPEVYRKTFGQCLQALRHDAELKKSMKWMKYINVQC